MSVGTSSSFTRRSRASRRMRAGYRRCVTLVPMRLAMLTGGGDCPGLNAVIRAVVRKGEQVYGDEAIGFYDAWQGVLADRWTPLTVSALRGMLPKGGTMLGTTRGSPLDQVDGPEL